MWHDNLQNRDLNEHFLVNHYICCFVLHVKPVLVSRSFSFLSLRMLTHTHVFMRQVTVSPASCKFPPTLDVLPVALFQFSSAHRTSFGCYENVTY